jgi:hypothetical protein
VRVALDPARLHAFDGAGIRLLGPSGAAGGAERSETIEPPRRERA